MTHREYSQRRAALEREFVRAESARNRAIDEQCWPAVAYYNARIAALAHEAALLANLAP